MAPKLIEQIINDLKNTFQFISVYFNPQKCIALASQLSIYCNQETSYTNSMFEFIKSNIEIIKKIIFSRPVCVQFTFIDSSFYLIFVEEKEYLKNQNDIDYYYYGLHIVIDYSFTRGSGLIMLN